MSFVPLSPASIARRAARLWAADPRPQDHHPANTDPLATERNEDTTLHCDCACEWNRKRGGNERSVGVFSQVFGMNRPSLLSLPTPSIPLLLTITKTKTKTPTEPSSCCTCTCSCSSSSPSSSYDRESLASNLKPNSELVTLYDVILPGTHDSAAYTARPDLVSRLTPAAMRYTAVRAAVTTVQTDFALTQTLTIFHQLLAGARFLDIRVTKRPGDDRFWTHHGMVLCAPLSHILSQINQFHHYCIRNRSPSHRKQHHPLYLPHVPVVSVFRTAALSRAERRALAPFVRRQLAHPVFEGDARALRTAPLSSLPPNIVAGLEDGPLDLSWGTDVWVNTYVADTKISFLSKTLRASVPRLARDSLLILGWTVTPSAVDIVLRVLTRGIMRPSVLAAATRLNLRFHDFAKRHVEQLKLSTNVVFFDDFDLSLASEVLSLNSAPFNNLTISPASRSHHPG